MARRLIYPLYQLGNPQMRIFRPTFNMTLVRPGKPQPPDTVQFRISMEHFLQLFQRDPEAYPGQPRDIVSPACPGSSPGPLPGNAPPPYGGSSFRPLVSGILPFRS
ncbi:hypothetical protein QTP70_030735 [Hemibagrus guttatus]|uniref:Uncharacterized protein n=1 Tax=Hemibagrus guttatus TaxID=175788 RepID=A0AAE0QP03_9TELE|nr:hypothetical protein QTP70_030735 [Hemibagrus guttatus]KAK3558498.1 hypothetical protein QTP86_018154 [Hemibagrus guttatus]